MKWMISGFILANLMISVAYSQTALTEDDWIPLHNEASRQQLFQSFIKKIDSDFDTRSLQKKFLFPQDTTFDTVKNQERIDSIFGLDISHYTNSNLRFDLLKSQNVYFVYVKATQGVTYKDPMFGKFWNSLDSLPVDKKVFRGAYHFLSSTAESSGYDQAERYVAYVNLHGGFKDEDLPPVMDLEWDIAAGSSQDRWQKFTPKEIVEKALAWLTRVEELTGKIPMMYTARSWWRSRNIPESEFAKFSRFRIWIADYSNSSLDSEIPAVPARAKSDLWQFTDQSTLSTGYKGNLDANIFHGTEDDFFMTFFGQK